MTVESEFQSLGLAPGMVTGARSFEIDKLGRLTGVYHKQVWRPGENIAECRVNAYTQGVIMASGGIVPPPWIAGGNVYYSWSQVTPAEEPKPEPRVHDLSTCTHGFYAFYDGSNDYHEKGRVSGVIDGYGEVVIGTRGFQCMKARIVALKINSEVPSHVASLIQRNYPAVHFFDSFKAMVAEFPPDGGETKLTPESDPTFWDREV